VASSTCPTAPSSASVCGVLDGAPGAWPKFIGHWFLRSALIMPGLAIAGVRDKRLITASLLSSTLVSLFLVMYTVTERGRKGMSWKRHRAGRSRALGRANAQPQLMRRRKRHPLDARFRVSARHARLPGTQSLCVEAQSKAEAVEMVKGMAKGVRVTRVTRSC
jgi:hypothetical protein